VKNLIDNLSVSVFEIPTDGPESDGTIEWDSTTMVLVELACNGVTGTGFSYAASAAATLIREKLSKIVLGKDALDIPSIWQELVDAVRNVGRPGIASTAISAVDIALWDLKARLLELPLVKLLGQIRPSIAAYGSGGFTSYTIERLHEQLGNWASAGLSAVKMKVGRAPEDDVKRVCAARKAIGNAVELFVDANGAYSRQQALAMAEQFNDFAVTWFEEPVSSDDLEGLRRIRNNAPAGMRITAGEYGYDAIYFRRMLEAAAVDTLQADATRCGGITGFLQAGTLCEAFQIPLSAHTAPSIHRHVCCSLHRAVNVEYFYDHYRIEQMFFDGAAIAAKGQLQPSLSRCGLGLELRRTDAERFKI
jgi:L-alanine-DL-glutamate epimerase-like enolase superfamily enzyme